MMKDWTNSWYLFFMNVGQLAVMLDWMWGPSNPVCCLCQQPT